MPRRPDTPTAVAFTGTSGAAEVGIGTHSVGGHSSFVQIYVLDLTHRNR